MRELRVVFALDSLTAYLIAISLVVIVSVLVSKGAGRYGIPGLLIFLVIGVLAGSGGPGGFAFSNYAVAQTFGILALICILHSGGLDTKLDDVRAVRGSGLLLSTVGTVIATLLIAIFAVYVLGTSSLIGFLLGATVASTDVAAVFTILRARSVSLRGRIRPLLEVESALNDPMAVFLSVGALAVITHPGEASLLHLVPSFFQQMIVGTLAGYGAGKASVWALNHANLEFEGLYPALGVALVVFTYATTQALGGSGFLAVYISGIVLGNAAYVHKRSLTVFHDGLAWLMQIVMFLVMGLLVVPRELWPVAWSGVALSAFLVFVARPISVMACLAPLGFSWREQLMISWGGLRGAVPIVLATYPLLAGVPEARTIFYLVFFVVFSSVLLQATTIPVVARWLKVDAPLPSPDRTQPAGTRPAGT